MGFSPKILPFKRPSFFPQKEAKGLAPDKPLLPPPTLRVESRKSFTSCMRTALTDSHEFEVPQVQHLPHILEHSRYTNAHMHTYCASILPGLWKAKAELRVKMSR